MWFTCTRNAYLEMVIKQFLYVHYLPHMDCLPLDWVAAWRDKTLTNEPGFFVAIDDIGIIGVIGVIGVTDSDAELDSARIGRKSSE